MRTQIAWLACTLSAGLLAASVRAQEIPPDVSLSYAADTGWVSNAMSDQGVIVSFPVHVDGASSLRLYFEQVALAGNPADGSGSILRLTSLLDGAVQTQDAVISAQWQGSTAYFNGDTVLVEVIAQPGNGRNRLVLRSVDAGAPPIFTKSQCGGTDDRVPSNDPREARLLPIGCTAWLINDCGHCFLTAGHCSGGIAVAEFNVPLSTAGGSLQHPGPQDQYVNDPASMQTNGGQGIGNDYAYFGCFANSQTGLMPGAAQGSSFEVVAPPPVPGVTIRVTGFGVDSSPPSANQTLQTSTGPFFASFGTTVQYQVDTEGGNSGSPVIWEQTGQAIGIHTHAGCSASSGNQGTSSQLPALQGALQSPKGVCNVSCNWLDLGNALAGTFGLPVATHQGEPVAGTLVRLQASKLPTFGTTNLVVGFSTAFAPFKGGIMVPEPDVILPNLPITAGAASFAYNFPAGVPSGSISVYQFWTADAAAVHGLSATNALQLTVP